jgi:hypothetical protein
LNKWMLGTVASLAGIGLYLILPIRTSAVEDKSWTSPVPSVTQQLEPLAPKQQTVAIETAKPVESSRAAPLPSTTPTPTKHPKPSIKETVPKPSKLEESQAPSLDATVEKWKLALAKEKGFETWQKAAWSSYTLGPGTHGWVVLLTKDNKELGYMIVYATESGGFRLTEYGTGSKPLFSLTTLYHSLIQLELIPTTTSINHFTKDPAIHIERWYTDALHAVWQITVNQKTFIIDAKTGEVLPLEKLPAANKKNSLLQGASELTEASEQLEMPSFDPYERLPWVNGKPLSIKTLAELKAALQEHPKLTYVALLYDEQVTVPLAVLGYHKWSQEEPYLVLDQEGPRYISLNTLVQAGHFYP